MEVNQCLLAIATYEGGLLGFSSVTANDMLNEDGSKQEFAFAASDTSLSCITSEGNLLAVAGSEEVIKLFDLKKKISCGELSGDVHQSTITALAISKQCTHLLSGDEKGVIGIWRVKDQEPLHKLEVKNTSRVISLSMHESGRMLLALYANGLIRLWNMLDARCLFKFKAGLSASEDSDADAGENREEAEGVDEEKADMEA